MTDSNRGYERHERHADDWHEWSTGISDRIVANKPARLFVRFGMARLIEVAEALVTSWAAGARELEGPSALRRAMHFTTDEVEFLLEVLPKAHAVARAEGVTVNKLSNPASPVDIRRRGWAVAVHNDYRLGGSSMTFWLFTRGSECVKGEGATDEEALDAVRAQLKERP